MDCAADHYHHEHWNGCHHLITTDREPCICGVESDGTYCCMPVEDDTPVGHP